ncbi:MAG: hypothetical protein L6Q57_09050 [Alphaproteobacteria bacterium]|nr:hypothetical protein [Alphaproteobacteria bacterium]
MNRFVAFICVSLFPSAVFAAEGHGEAVGPALPQMDVATFPSQLFWLLICFGALFWFMSSVAIPRLGKVRKSREDTLEGDLALARQYKQQADDEVAAYDALIRAAYAEAGAQLQAAEVQIRANAEAQIDAFRARASALIEEAEREIESMRRESLKSIDQIAAEVAVLAAEKIVGLPADIDQARSVVQTLNQKAA